jgi:hypothetical protein
MKRTFRAVPVPPGLCYWVVPGRFLAGPRPCGTERLREILNERIDVFISLQPPGERGTKDYSRALHRLAARLQRRVRFLRRPIPNGGVYSPEQMSKLLDTIDCLLAAGHNIFLHCRAGDGRTGLLVGCWLVRHGLSGKEALRRIEILRSHDQELRMWSSPQTLWQCDMVRQWHSLDSHLVRRQRGGGK